MLIPNDDLTTDAGYPSPVRIRQLDQGDRHVGLFSFVKSAGSALFGKDDEKEIEKEAQAQAPSGDEMAAVREKLRKAKMVARMKQQLEQNGLTVDGAEISVDGDTVKISGTVEDQETREKVLLVLGNNEGIGAVDDQLEVTKTEPEATFYTVERGDTLSKIAKEHYGNAMKYPVIFDANKPMLSDPDKIYPGQVLRIPPIED